MEIRPLAPGEEPAAAAALTDAFQRDAFAQWLMPDPDVRRAGMAGMFDALLAARPEGCLVDVVAPGGGIEAVAIWKPPGMHEVQSAPAGARPEVADAFARVEAATPAQPYWYLSFLGARTLGAGHGTALLRSRQQVTDAAGLPTALWTGAEVNLAFYARCGYDVLTRLDLDGATAWWLWREPRP